MAYDEFLEERINIYLDKRGIEYLSKKMMGGLCYLVDDKMCFGIVKDQLMARVGDYYIEALDNDGVTEMNFTKRPMKGYVFVHPEVIDFDDQLEFWIEKCLVFNPFAQSSKKK